MVSPNTSLFIRIFFFLSLLVAAVNSHAQCNPPDQEPSTECETAPLICLLNSCYETLNNPVNCCTGFCGPNTAIHNPEYFQFIPTCPDVEIFIHVDACDSGNGLQSALLDMCPWQNGNVITCDPGAGVGQTMMLIASGLVVGQVYWLLIDGSAGALCDYTITHTECIFSPGLNGELDDAEATPYSVCQGYEGLLLEASPPVGNAHGYYWVLEWSGDTVTSTLPTHSIDIPGDVPPGVYEICVRAFSGCDTSDMEVCFDVEIYDIPDEIKPTEYFCPEEFPFSWGSITVSGPGDYFQMFSDPDGCTYDSMWTVEEYPEVPLGILDTLHCEESLIYEGDTYDTPGTYDLVYPGMGLNGCDSMAELTVTLAALDAFVDISCENGEFVLSVLIQDLIPFNAQLEYEWFESGVLISTDIQLYVLDGGVYDVDVTVITSAGSCVFSLDQFAFNAEDYRPDPPNMGFMDTLICAQSGVFFEVIEDPFGDPLEYVWSSINNVPIFQDGSNIAEFDFSNTGPAEICVYAINDCGPGPETCFMVDIKPAPMASFTYEPFVCADSSTVVTFTGSASANAIVIWDFDNPASQVGTGLGPYTITYAVPGSRTITLTVIEPGCDTATFTGVVDVSTLNAPVINCSSTLSSVTFDWADVAGSSGYLVSINGAPAVPSAMSTWTESSLTPGTVVNMTLTIVSAGPCDDIVLMAMCTAEDCPAPTIVITGQDSACLNNPTIIDLDATVNGLPGVGTWSGAGIVDPVMGLFDPVVATDGQHPITFSTLVMGCPFSEQYLITVFDSITADFIIDPEICITDEATLTYTGNAQATAMFNYTLAPADIISGSGEGPYQLSWTNPGSKTTRLQISENGCMSSVVSHTTNVVAELQPAVINCTPNTSGIIFTWDVDPAAMTHIVNVLVGGPGTPIGTDSMEFTGLNPGDPVQLEIVTISAGPCPDRRDTLECIARACPMPVITITPVDDICLYPGTANVDLEVTVTNGAGTGEWAGPGVTDVVNGVFNPVMAGAAAHQVSYNYTDDGCDFVRTTTIDVYDVPGAFISNTDLMITCLAGSIFLDGSSSSGGPLMYKWTTSNGVIENGANTAIAEASAQGVYQLLVTNTISGCVDSVSVTVTQDANIPTADAGPDKIITCDSLVFTLGGVSTSGPNIIYSWTTPDGNIVGATSGMRIMVDEVGQYNILVRDTSNGCQSTDRALITIDTAVATITLTPGDTIDCNTPVSTVTSMLSAPVADYTLAWSTVDGKIEGASTGSSINVSQGGTYTLLIENKNNGCQDTEDALVPESTEIINDVDVSLMNIECHGDNNGALTVNSVDGGTPPYTFQWSGTSQSGTMLTSLGPGIYTLTVSDGNGCSFVQMYQVTEPDLVTLDIGPNKTVNVEDSVSLTINTNLTSGGTGSIVWSEYDGMFCPGCPTFDFIASESATISATISDTSGCVATDSMRLTVLVPRIYYIPNVFSPNGDGVNDFFFVSGKFNLINVGYLKIYDRWGNELFEATDMVPGAEAEGWDGRFNGEFMLPGVYAFIARLDYEDGRMDFVKGDLTIIR